MCLNCTRGKRGVEARSMSRASRVETRLLLVAERANRGRTAPGGLATERALIGPIGNENNLRCSPGVAKGIECSFERCILQK